MLFLFRSITLLLQKKKIIVSNPLTRTFDVAKEWVKEQIRGTEKYL